MKAAAKCEKHCELHDSVNHLKVERILFFRVDFESMFSQTLHWVSVACVCGSGDFFVILSFSDFVFSVSWSRRGSFLQ